MGVSFQVYRIRNREGTYSTGGNHPYYTKRGKAWSGKGPLKLHLSGFIYDPRDITERSIESLVEEYGECTVEYIDIASMTVKQTPILQWMLEEKWPKWLTQEMVNERRVL